MSNLLDAFIAYEFETKDRLAAHSVVGVPVGTRLQRVIRHENGWQLWVATRDFVHGTYYLLGNDGSMVSITVREDEGDEIITVRPSDDAVRQL